MTINLSDLINQIFNEDCRETIARIPDSSVDAIVTDAPYEFGFMGKDWDSSGIAYNVKMWSGCFRILKPGGYLLAFGGTRTSHRMVCAIEDAGFEIRDSILWLYGSGFPKNMDISKQIIKETDTRDSKQWNGWGTALKPAHEPICVARKPISEKTVALNVLKYGTGAINIDESRIPHNGEKLKGGDNSTRKMATASPGWDRPWRKDEDALKKRKQSADIQVEKSEKLGRFPSNVILDEFTAKLLDQQAPKTGAFAKVKRGQTGKSKGVYGDFAQKGDDGDSFYDDLGGASRFYYIVKATQDERNAGLQQFVREKQNIHCTVKPVKLIQYLQKLVTPPGGIVYDPFGGSGTSAPAAQNNGFKWIMSELIKEHYDIAVKRIYNNGGLWL